MSSLIHSSSSGNRNSGGDGGGSSRHQMANSMPQLDDNAIYYDDDGDKKDRVGPATTEAHELTRLTRQQYEDARELLKMYQSQLLPSPPPAAAAAAAIKVTKKRKVASSAATVARRTNRPAAGGKKTKMSLEPPPPPPPPPPLVTDAITSTTTSATKTMVQQQQQRSFHSFVETLNCYDLLPHDWQQTLVASWTTDEKHLCTGRLHPSHHDQFHLLCQGTNVNPDCVMRQIARKIQGLTGDSRRTIVTDQMALRFVHLWYAYATPDTCAIESTTVSNVVELLTNQDRRQQLLLAGVEIDDLSVGRMCHLCINYFLRFINGGGKSYPRPPPQQQQQLSPPQYLPLAQAPSPYLSQQPATRKRKTAVTVAPPTGSLSSATATTAPAAVRITGLGAARKKISAPTSPLPPTPSSNGKDSSSSPTPPPLPPKRRLDDNLVAYMSDYEISTSEDDDNDNNDDDAESYNEYSDYDVQDNAAAVAATATTNDNSENVTTTAADGASKKKQ